MSDSSEEPPRHVTAPCTALIVSRRRFLGGAVFAAAAAPLMSACEFVRVYGDTEVEEEVDFDLSEADYEALQDVGGTACLEAGAVTVLLVRADEESVLAFDQVCPHANLDMGPCDAPENFKAVWDADADQLTCRWHNSVFDAQGTFLPGPSQTSGVDDLRRFEVEFDAEAGTGTVFVAGRSDGG